MSNKRGKQQLVTNGPVEFEKFIEHIDHFRGIQRVCLDIIKKNQKITTCNRMDLETIAF